MLLTTRIDHIVLELERVAGGRLRIHRSSPYEVKAQRGRLKALRGSWLDPVLTMLRLSRRIWNYPLVVNYYSRNGYWLGLLRRLYARGGTLVWIGFAPNPQRPGLLGRLREIVTYQALLGCDLVVCNTTAVVAASRRRYPKAAGRLAFARWGGAEDTDRHPPRDDGYVFTGGRTNRDFATVCEAVRDLGLPAMFAVGGNVRLPDHLPTNVEVHRNVCEDEFQRLLAGARVVVIALDHPEVSSGQVVLNQAMRSGKAVICTRTAGIEEYLDHGTDGVLVKPHDVAELKSALQSLFADRERRQALGTAARGSFEARLNARVYARELAALLGLA